MKSVLRLRIDGLINDLHNAHDPDTWWDYLGLAGQAAEGPSLHLWRRVLAGIYAEAEEHIEGLEDARDSLDAGSHTEAETWALFEKVAVKSEYVFRECLELIGGLALRARLVNSSIG